MDYDEEYDTKVSRPYANGKVGYIFGPCFIILGMIAIAITIAELYRGVYNQDLAANGPFVFTWDENPIWPSYGKGFWVGLILMVAGVVGIISSCEHTITSIYAFCVLSGVSAVLGFYLLISAIVPVHKLSGIGGDNLASFENVTLGLNSVLMGVGGLSVITGTLSAIISARLGGCCTERRGYGAAYLNIRQNIAGMRANTQQPHQPLLKRQ